MDIPTGIHALSALSEEHPGDKLGNFGFRRRSRFSPTCMIYENRTTDLISWEGLWIVRRFDHTCYLWDQAGTTRGQSPAQMSIRCTSVYFVFCKTNKHCCSRNLFVFLYYRTDFSRHRFQVSSLLIMKDSDYDISFAETGSKCSKSESMLLSIEIFAS